MMTDFDEEIISVQIFLYLVLFFLILLRAAKISRKSSKKFQISFRCLNVMKVSREMQNGHKVDNVCSCTNKIPIDEKQKHVEGDFGDDELN